MRVLTSERHIVTPWRNGGGVTRQIAAFSDKTLHQDFLWRVSAATIASPGPFSKFPDVDRSIALIEGDGFLLEEGDNTYLVDHASPPHSFSGDVDVFCSPVGGASVDLNVMTRRGYFDHRVRKVGVMGWGKFDWVADETIVVATAPLELSFLGRASLRKLDAIMDLHRGTSLDLYSERLADLMIIELWRRR